MKRKNVERAKEMMSILVLLLGAVLVIFPLFIKADRMIWGYAVMTIGVLVTLTGLVSVVIFHFRAKVMALLLSDTGLITRWSLHSEQSKKMLQETREYLKASRMAALFIAAIFLLIGGGIYLADRERPLLFLIIMVSLAAALVLIVQLYTRLKLQAEAIKMREVVFHRQGLLFKGDLMAWDGLFYQLESVLPDPLDPDNLLVVYKYLHGRYLRRQRGLLSIPSPGGSTEAIKQVVRLYGKAPSPELIDFLQRERIRNET